MSRTNQMPKYEKLLERIPFWRMNRAELLMNETTINMELEEWHDMGKLSTARYNALVDKLTDIIEYYLERVDD